MPAFGVGRVTGGQVINGTYTKLIAKPSTTFGREYLVNGPTQVLAGGYGTGYQSGDVPALYDTGTPANGQGWGPKPGQWSLSRYYPVTGIVSGVASADDSILVATWRMIGPTRGKTASIHAVDASGVINVYSGAPASEAIITGMTVTCWNRFATLQSGAWVYFDLIDGNEELAAGRCSA